MAIPYFSVIRLRHSIGPFLASNPDSYSHKGGSNQQMVFCVENPDEISLWMIRPQNLCDYDGVDGVNIGEGAAVRLTHIATGRNLHSHGFKSPSGQQEVSCYGSDGVGNQDDNWLISSRENNRQTPLPRPFPVFTFSTALRQLSLAAETGTE